MKRFLFFLLILFALTCFVGCDIDYDETIGCDPQASELSYDGGSFQVNLKSYVKWTATTSATWLSIKPDAGRGDTTVIITVEPTTNYRKAVITFDNGYATATVTVQQSSQASINSLNTE